MDKVRIALANYAAALESHSITEEYGHKMRVRLWNGARNELLRAKMRGEF